MEEEIKRVKKYIYVSTKIRAELEEEMQKNNILIQVRFINSYDITNFFRSEIKNLNGIDFLFLDLRSFETSKENEIIMNLKLIRQKYTSLRVIVLAEGYKQGDIILRKSIQFRNI